MVGAGNDFIVIEGASGLNLKNLALKACDRTNGIGADGILIFDKSQKADYKMRIINADGSEAEMCGNGARCMAVYIAKNKKPTKKLFTLETLAGKILCEAKDEIAHVRLSEPKDYRTNIPLTINNKKLHVSFINTGVPHAVVYVNNLSAIDVAKIGRIIRYHKAFAPKGTNVNFVEQINKTLVANRTYERGVEDETKACGTGSVACAIITYLKLNPTVKEKEDATMNVKTKSGEILKISFDIITGKIANVWLKGSAKIIAKGDYYV
jgi:diaminopimelate epimerase